METITKEPAIRFSNDTLRTIYSRRAVRKYKSFQPDRNTITQIIDAGRMAPSAINKQPWKFYVMTDKNDLHLFSKEIRKAVMKGVIKSGIKGIVKATKDYLGFAHDTKFLADDDPVFHNAPVVIIITAPKDNEWAALDIGACAQNMMLAARSLGFDSCPVGMAKYITETKDYPRLNIPPTEQVHLAVILGYSDESPEVHERKKDNLIFL